jgi:hypothetical protein
LFGESTVLPPLFAIAGFGAGTKTPPNHFKDRAEDVADNTLWLVENLDVVQLAQFKRQLVIVAQLYAVADDQQIAVKVASLAASQS